MAKALQRRRGTAAEHANFTGLEGEFTYDTTEKRIVAHDGVTKGGIPLAKKAELDSAKTELEGKIEQVSSSLDPRILDAASQSDILEAVSQATVGNVDAPTLDGLLAQIAANASNIASKPTPVRYVVEKWSSGTEWYTKYNDGWIEQGGSSTCGAQATLTTLVVPFSSSEYAVQATEKNLSGLGYACVILSRTSTAFNAYVYTAGSTIPFDWEAKGY